MRKILALPAAAVLLLLAGSPALPIRSLSVREGSMDQLVWTFSYDPSGRLEAVGYPSGSSTRLRYEPAGPENGHGIRVEASTGAAPPVRLLLDSYGRRIAAQRGERTERHAYDARGNLSGVIRQDAQDLSFDWDPAGRRTATRLGGLAIRRRYDFLGRPSELVTPAGPITYQYHAGSRSTIRTLPNGIRTIWRGAPDGTLASVTHAGADGVVLARFRYEYRPDGLIAAVDELRSGSRTLHEYGYGPAGRLIEHATSDGRHIRFAYDDAGNLVRRTEADTTAHEAEHDWAGRLTLFDGRPAEYDGSANLTRYSLGLKQRSFTYTAGGALEGADDVVSFTYDGLGNLVERTSDLGTTEFVPDPTAGIWRPLFILEEGAPPTTLVWQGDVPLASIRGRTAVFFLEDHLGTARLVVDEQGRVVGEPVYDAFGAPLSGSPSEALTPGFAGLLYDPAARVYLTRHRAYDPVLGRFLQADPQHRIPSGSPRDVGLYAYAGHDPVQHVDRTGLAAVRVTTTQAVPGMAASDRGVSHRLPNFFESVWGGRYTFDPWSAYREAVVPPVGTHLLERLTKTHLMDHAPWAPVLVSHFSTVQSLGSALSTTLNALDYFGRAVMTYNPPTHLTHRQGRFVVGQRAVSGSGFRYEVGGTTDAWASRGILSHRWSSLSTDFGHSTFRNTTLTPATSPVERLMGFLFPPGTYFEPAPAMGPAGFGPLGHRGAGASMSRTVRTTSEQYRVSTRGGYTEISPVQGTAPSPPDPGSRAPDGVLPAGPPGGGPGLADQLTSPVGGVRLSGAAAVLEGLDQIEGLVVDERGQRLVLLSRGEETRTLPGLRLDDVVTVFRQVYGEGEGPWITIDPDPRDPIGDSMMVRHGPTYAGTYVAWVLYHSDRLLKSYSLGEDNLTGRRMDSSVAGYPEVLAAGDAPTEGSVWERYWIVPDDTRLRRSTNGLATLVELGLRVNTERMVMRNGVLEPDPDPTPSRGARAFARWFTDHYDRIAEEAAVDPPPGSGLDQPVNVLRELKRIAYITALAETMRDRGAPLPHWMRNWKVAPVAVPPRTPATRVERRGDGFVRRIYGGVRLSSANDATLIDGDPEADAAAAAPIRSPEPEQDRVTTIDLGSRTFRAAVLPGPHAHGLLPATHETVDLVVDAGAGHSLVLARRYKSFFRPDDGTFSSPWSLDEPRLIARPLPVSRDGGTTTYRRVHDLVTPLGGWNAVLSTPTDRDDLGSGLLTDPDRPEILGLGRSSVVQLGGIVNTVFLRDGRRWYFGEEALFLGERRQGALEVRRRGREGRLQRLELWRRGALAAAVDLSYDGAGRVHFARGSDGATAEYRYGADQRLEEVHLGSGSILRYRYEGDLLVRIERDGQPIRSFRYAEGGRLRSERAGTGPATEYHLRHRDGGPEVTLQVDGEDPSATLQFDHELRPTEWSSSDGARAHWRYRTGDSWTMTLSTADGRSSTLAQSSDGREVSMTAPDGIKHRTRYGAQGRPLSVSSAGAELLRFTWLHDGRLASLSRPGATARPEYAEDGTLTAMTLSEPTVGDTVSMWRRVELDPDGRPTRVTDYSGLDIEIQRHEDGRPEVIRTGEAGIRYRYDRHGRPRAAETSWGDTELVRYGADGEVDRIERRRAGGSRSMLELSDGHVRKIRTMDDHDITLAYRKMAGGVALDHVDSPDGRISYAYAPGTGRLREVRVGTAYVIHYAHDDEGRITRIVMRPASRR